jgi:VanZ family protein
VHQHSHIRLDHVLNVVFYLPAAPLAAALGWPLPAGVAAGAALSSVAEISQVFSSTRAPNGNDVIANVAGAAGGAVGVLLYRRRSRR